jgi:hypothetical protein
VANYGRQWDEYRRSRNIVLVALVGFVPFSAVARLLANLTKIPSLFAIAMFGWLVLLVCGAGGLGSFRCPRCGELFGETWWYRVGVFARRCMHCGLKKYSNG